MSESLWTFFPFLSVNLKHNHANAPQCSILVNIKMIPQLFSLYVAHDEHLDMDINILDLDDEQAAKIKVYPQAFLHKYGHLQSDSTLSGAYA
ncbi:hypothetical protein DFJ58DRAFT_734021 [Suillus subalutaceus]|uniref:uncharacterized protein n=1 Tax=Suillus subalutaceus TaxID=48586 RepID=UPI001B862C5E|nr:uncharacterized protein DFJ58DRAFT_734021 [Suillus subalutaceus]KAG1838098.1 hypothetical protein DFJ58DRAFT_734021 [Suillus subalutaceus]